MKRWHITTHAVDRMRERIPGMRDASREAVITVGLGMLNNAMPFGGAVGSDRMFAASRDGETFVFVACPGGDEDYARWVIKSLLTLAQASANLQVQLRRSRIRGRAKRRLEHQRRDKSK